MGRCGSVNKAEDSDSVSKVAGSNGSGTRCRCREHWSVVQDNVAMSSLFTLPDVLFSLSFSLALILTLVLGLSSPALALVRFSTCYCHLEVRIKLSFALVSHSSGVMYSL